jgi:hypothetical protein
MAAHLLCLPRQGLAPESYGVPEGSDTLRRERLC